MIPTLSDYQEVVGAEAIEELRLLAALVHNQRCQHINSTPVGGGVAELLTRLVPLMQELGIETTWNVIKGDDQFSVVTKALDQALLGKANALSEAMLESYRATIEMNLRDLVFTGDVIFVHDPEPAGLVAHRKADGRRWIWHYHLDLSTPGQAAWQILRSLAEKYDAAICSIPEFAQPLSIPQYVIPPSIDPLNDRNKDIDGGWMLEVLAKYKIDPERPIIIQTGRFDRAADPLGVITAYRLTKKQHNCQLVLAGDGTIDDPDNLTLVSDIQAQAASDPDLHAILLPPFSDMEINALVRASTVVMQKPLREDFGLSVAEAMWKRKPVIGGAVGGIRRQIVNGFTGFLVHSPEGAARRAAQLLADADMCRSMGDNGRMYVMQNFLFTRQVRDHLLVLLAQNHPEPDVTFLA